MLISTACTLVSAAGLGVAFLVARRRRYAAALRVAAVALVPVALAMTGIMRFILNMTFNPVAWAGFGVLGLAVLMFLGARLADRKGSAPAVEAGASSPAMPAPAPGLPAKRGGNTPAKPADKGGGEDFSDIEAILKKHGI